MVYPPIKLVEEIIDIFERSNASELEFGDGAFKFRIVRSPGQTRCDNVGGQSETVGLSAMATAASIETPTDTASIEAFMHGMFHRSSSPLAEPFVQVGSAVVEGQQVGILEAMKVFMPILSPKNGFVVFIHAENGIEVVPGQILMSLSETDPREVA